MLSWVVLGILIVILSVLLSVLLAKLVFKKTRCSDFIRIFILLVVSSLLIILPYLHNSKLDDLNTIYGLIIGVGVNELLGTIYAMFINNYPNKKEELEQELSENKLLFNYIYISVLFSIFIAKNVVKVFFGEYTIFVIFVITTLITIGLIKDKEKILKAEKESSREQKDDKFKSDKSEASSK